MSPSRGEAGGATEGASTQAGADGGSASPANCSAEAVHRARVALRLLLADLHVLDALPERSRMLAVDAELPVHSVLTTVLGEQHPQPQLRAAPHTHQGLSEEASHGSSGGAHMRREGAGGSPEEPHPSPLGCGLASPSLPSNVLAEVCEFDSAGPNRLGIDPAAAGGGEDGADEREPPLRRQWTSPDDGWGMHLSSFPMQDLEKMPMGMPVTVTELADFLAHACGEPEPSAGAPNGEDTSAGGARWAEPVAGGGGGGRISSKDGSSTPEPDSDMLDWSLKQWRAHRLKASGGEEKAIEPPKSDSVESAARLFVEDNPRAGWPVLVHRVPLAPPRPILCTDDPEASLLKAVELLLAYPELDALPIVSPVRCTVVAHLTLSYCLAYMLPRMRGSELLPLAAVSVGGSDAGATSPRKFDSQTFKPESWAASRTAEVQQPPLVLSQTQTVRELLAFFARTHHSGVPVVEDNGGGGVLGLLSRRDLLNFLDLTMQSARRRSDSAAAAPTEGGAAAPDAEERIDFDLEAPVEVVLDALRRHRSPAASDEASTSCPGAALITEKELTLKALPLRALAAENRKLLFVQDRGGGAPPKLLRIVAVSDVWRLLLGSEQERKAALQEEALVAQDM